MPLLSMKAATLVVAVLGITYAVAAPIQTVYVAEGAVDDISNVGSSFNMAESLQFLNYSYAAYCSEHTLMGWNCSGWCKNQEFQTYGTFVDTLTENYGYVGYDKTADQLLVAFRGSSNIQNFIDDADIFKTKYNDTDAKVHSGFYDGWKRVSSHVLKLVADVLSDHSSPKRIACTGHSLGAAVSALAALELNDLYGSRLPVIVHNFGMPRVGDKAFSELYRKRITSSYRVVNHHDIVPHLPWEDWGFYHVNTEVWDMSKPSTPLKDIELKICDGSGEDSKCSDSVPWYDMSVDDHLKYYGFDEDHCGYKADWRIPEPRPHP